MTVVGSDVFADAPLLEVGTSSAYTPNAGYSVESGEPSAWGGKTAWWKVVPTASEFHYIDVLYSTGSTRAWVYRQTGSGFGGLLLVNDPGADTQGGWTAGAGQTYYIRLDSDGSDVSYVASVGMLAYDELYERFPLTGPRFGDPTRIVEDYFDGITPASEVPWRTAALGILGDAVSGAPGTSELGGYAEMLVGQYAAEVVEEYPTYNSGAQWYGDPPDTTYGHPILDFGVTSDGNEPIVEPDGFGHSRSRLVVVMSASDGPPLTVDADSSPDNQVRQLRMDGAFTSTQAVRYEDTAGLPLGTEVDVPGVLTEFTFRIPTGLTNPTTDYNNGTLQVTFAPNWAGTDASDPQPTPVGVWRVSYVGIEVRWESDDPLPYEPPPPPLAVTYVRQFPTSHAGTWGGSPRIFPPPKVQRIIGGHT
jgi:hypothetical protein